MVSDLRFTPASANEQSRGLLGWLCVTAGPWRLDSLTLRRRRDGRLSLSFPVRIDGRGRTHPVVRPIDDRARRDIEAQVFRALGLTQKVQR